MPSSFSGCFGLQNCNCSDMGFHQKISNINVHIRTSLNMSLGAPWRAGDGERILEATLRRETGTGEEVAHVLVLEPGRFNPDGVYKLLYPSAAWGSSLGAKLCGKQHHHHHHHHPSPPSFIIIIHHHHSPSVSIITIIMHHHHHNSLSPPVVTSHNLPSSPRSCTTVTLLTAIISLHHHYLHGSHKQHYHHHCHHHCHHHHSHHRHAPDHDHRNKSIFKILPTDFLCYAATLWCHCNQGLETALSMWSHLFGTAPCVDALFSEGSQLPNLSCGKAIQDQQMIFLEFERCPFVNYCSVRKSFVGFVGRSQLVSFTRGLKFSLSGEPMLFSCRQLQLNDTSCIESLGGYEY